MRRPAVVLHQSKTSLLALLSHGLTPAQEVAFGVMHTSLFNFPFPEGTQTCVFRFSHLAGSNQIAVVQGAFLIAALHFRIVPDRFHNGRFQIIDHYSFGDTFYKIERIPVAAQPGFHLLVEDKLHILVAVPGKGHHKSPCGALLSPFWIENHPGIAKVHLGFVPRRPLNLHCGVGRLILDLFHKAVDGGVGPFKALFFKSMIDGLGLHVLFDQFFNDLPVGLYRGDVLRWLCAGQCRFYHRLELFYIRQLFT